MTKNIREGKLPNDDIILSECLQNMTSASSMRLCPGIAEEYAIYAPDLRRRPNSLRVPSTSVFKIISL